MAATTEELTVLARIKDDISAGLAKIRAEADALNKKVDEGAGSFRRSTTASRGYSKTLNSTSKTLRNLGSVTGGPLSSGLTKAGGALDKLSQTKAVGVLSALSSAGQKFGSSINLHSKLTTLSSDLEDVAAKTMKFTAGFAAASAGLALFGLKSLASLQQAEVGLQTQAGGAAPGILKSLEGMTGIFSTQTLASQAQSMLTLGTPTSTVTPRLGALANIASTQADPAQALQSLVSGINSIEHTGRITSEGLDSLANAGLPGYEVLSQDTGRSKLQVQNLVNSNLYPAQAFLNQIDALSGPVLAKFKGGMARDTQTIGGMFDTLKNRVTLDLTNDASPLAKSLGQQMPAISRLVNQLVNTMAPFGVHLLGSLIGPLARDLPRAMTKLAPILPKLEASFGKLAGAVMKILPALAQLGADVAPILPAMISLAADLLPVLDVFAKLLNKSPLLRDAFAGLLVTMLAYNKLSKIAQIFRGMASAVSLLAEKLGALSEAERTEGLARETEAGEDVASDAKIGGAAFLGGGLAGGLLAGVAGGVGAGILRNKLGQTEKKKGTRGALAAASRLGSDFATPLDIPKDATRLFHGIFGGGSPASVATSVAQSVANPTHITVHQTNNINGTHLNESQMTNVMAKANREAFRRAVAPGNTAQPPSATLHAVGKTG